MISRTCIVSVSFSTSLMRVVQFGRCNSVALWSHPERTGHRFMPVILRTSLRPRTFALCVVILSLLTFAPSEAQAKKNKESKKHDLANAVLWTEPGDIKSRDLFHGIGGSKGQPEAAVTFDKEDMSGTSPKF